MTNLPAWGLMECRIITNPALSIFIGKRKRSAMTKAPIPTENFKKQTCNTKIHQNVQLQNDCRPTKDGQLEKQQPYNSYGLPVLQGPPFP